MSTNSCAKRCEVKGWIRPVYFTLLTSHTILAVVIAPSVLITLTRTLRERFDRHRVIARWTLPLWFYVSVTGVVMAPQRTIEKSARGFLSDLLVGQYGFAVDDLDIADVIGKL